MPTTRIFCCGACCDCSWSDADSTGTAQVGECLSHRFPATSSAATGPFDKSITMHLRTGLPVVGSRSSVVLRSRFVEELFFFEWDLHVIFDVSLMRDTRRQLFFKPSWSDTSASTRNEGRTFDNEVELDACSTIGFIGDSEALRPCSWTRGVCAPLPHAMMNT